eukprot:1960294-Pleurochrysis_carterae.AAC.1
MSGGSSSTSGSSASCSGSAMFQGSAALLQLSPAQPISADHIEHDNLRFGAFYMIPYACRV